ncbi:MAG: DUF5106 domain-containing protein [Alistipes sp.]
MNRIILLVFVTLCVGACGGRGVSSKGAITPSQRVFLPALAPSHLSAEQQQEYLRLHYWDRFDFTDTLFVTQADSIQMLEAYAHYVALLSARPTDAAPMDSLMRRAAVSRSMLDYFVWLAEKVLHDPNSPLRNDEFYIPVLQRLLASSFYDTYEKMAPASDLKMALQNRLGQTANDFRYTTASGATGTLYGVKADFVLLFINNPGCAACKQIREEIVASENFTRWISDGKLKVLALYTDEDLTEWRDYLDQIPKSWINGYDAHYVVRDQGLYNLQAIPALYLLDGAKRVIVKDSSDLSAIEALLSAPAV